MLLAIPGRRFSSASLVSRTAPTVSSFRTLGLAPAILQSLVQQRILVPTDIQAQLIPKLLSESSNSPRQDANDLSKTARGKKNFLCLAETGSGKTLAYLLPILTRILEHRQRSHESNNDTSSKTSDGNYAEKLAARSPYALIVLPNVGLAHHVSSVLAQLTAANQELQSIHHQILDSFSATHGTGGDVLCLPPRTDIVLCAAGKMPDLQDVFPDVFRRTHMVVVDEADWTLSESFPGQRPLRILSELYARGKVQPPEAGVPKQMIFIGATMPSGKKSVRAKILQTFGPAVEMVSSARAHRPVSSLQMEWRKCDSALDPIDELQWKHEQLLDVIGRTEQPGRILVFCKSPEIVDQTMRWLQKKVQEQALPMTHPILVQRLHKAVTGTERNQVVRAYFRAAEPNKNSRDGDPDSDSKQQSLAAGSSIQVLVATDLAARGMDCLDIQKVVQFDFATDLVSYLHRIGRTARAGRTGQVVHLVTDKDARLAEQIIEAQEKQQELAAGGVQEEATNVYSRLFSRNRSLRTRLRRKEHR